MTWELGYFYGLFTGGAAVGLIGLFVHAGYWEHWTRRFAAVTHERDAADRAVGVLEVECQMMTEHHKKILVRLVRADAKIIALEAKLNELERAL